MKLLLNLSIMSFLASNAQLSADTWQLESLQTRVAEQNFAIKEARLEVEAARARAIGGFSLFLPELGGESGIRGSRETEKRWDHSYYGYARWKILNGFNNLQNFSILRTLRTHAESERGLEEKRVLREVTQLFYTLIYWKERETLQKEDLALVQENAVRAQKKISAGLATESDNLEFELLKQDHELDFSQIERERISVELKLKELLKILESDAFEIAGEIPEALPLTTDLETLAKALIQRNSDVLQAKSDLEVAKAEYRSAIGDWLPEGNLEAQYGKLAETDFVTSQRNSWMVMGTLTLPLFSWGKTFRAHQEKAFKKEKAELKLERKEREAETNLHTQWEELRRLFREHEVLAKKIQVSQKYYRMSLDEYRRGVKNSPDVAAASEVYFSARLRQLENRLSFQKSRLEIAGLVGEGPDWKP